MAGPWERYQQQPSGPWDRYARPVERPKEEEEERSYLADIGRAIVRGAGTAIEGISRPIQEAPEIVSEFIGAGGALSPALRAAQPAIQTALRIGAPEFRETVAPVTTEIQEAGRSVRESVLPRRTAGLGEAYEAGGIPGALASLGETVAESAAPTLAALGTAVATRSPRAAASVMGLGITPQTYTGIRERQAEEGIDDVGRAVAGTAASAALDVFTGVGGAVRDIGREAAEGVLRSSVTQAAKRVATTGAKESGTEVLQTAIEQVAGGADPTTKQSMLESLEAGLAGALGGVAFGTAGEGVRAALPTREAAPETPRIAEPAAPTAPPPPPVGVPPEVASATPISTLEIEDIEGTPTRIEILSAPDDRGNVWVRDQAGAINSVPQNILERMGATFEPQPEPVPTEPPVSPAVPAPPPEAPPATTPPGVSPIAEPAVPVEPEAPTPPEAPTAMPVEPVVPEPLPEPEPAPEPIAPPDAPKIRDDQTRDYWRSNLDRQREQVQAQVDTLSQQPDAEPTQIETLNQRLAEIEEDYRGIERGEAPIPRARPLDDTTASILAEPNVALAEAVRDLPAVGVMDWFAKNGTTDFHRELAQRVGGLMKAMEQAGFEFNWGVYDQNYQPKDGAERDNYNYVMKKPRVRGAAWSHSQEGAARTGTAGKRVAPDYAFDRVDIGVKGPGLLNSGANEVTILHEFAHSVTVAAIDQLRSKKISPNSRVGQVVKELRSLKRSAVTHKNKLLNDIANGKPVDPRLAQALRNLEGTNAWKDEKELIVQGLTNIDMQIVLKSMPYKKTNGFVEFIREIGRLIGMTEKDMNGLRRLFELTDELIPTAPEAQQEVIQAMMKPGEYRAAVTPSEVEAPTATAIGEEPVAPASTEVGEPDAPAGAVNAQGRPYVQVSLGD